MSNNLENASAQWKVSIAVLQARIEDLKIRSDAEYRALHNRLDTQIAELQRELKRLAAEIARAGPDAYIQSVSTQLNELKAKGDAAYELLQATRAPADAERESREG